LKERGEMPQNRRAAGDVSSSGFSVFLEIKNRNFSVNPAEVTGTALKKAVAVASEFIKKGGF